MIRPLNALWLAAFCFGWAGAARAETPVIIFAAASLKAAIGDLSAAWIAQGHAKPGVSLDSSGALAKQIEQGAPAQIFISADEKWMDYADKKNLLAAGTRKDVLTNTLVLIAPADHATPLTIAPDFGLAAVLGSQGRLAVGDTATVPAGIYAKQSLIKLGVWSQVSAKLAPAASVKAALLLVERGEAPAGIVYRTDALGDPKIKVIGTFPPSSHDPIVYPFALVAKSGETPQARALLTFLEGKQARAIYLKYGFGLH